MAKFNQSLTPLPFKGLPVTLLRGTKPEGAQVNVPMSGLKNILRILDICNISADYRLNFVLHHMKMQQIVA